MQLKALPLQTVLPTGLPTTVHSYIKLWPGQLQGLITISLLSKAFPIDISVMITHMHTGNIGNSPIVGMVAMQYTINRSIAISAESLDDDVYSCQIELALASYIASLHAGYISCICFAKRNFLYTAMVYTIQYY